MGYNGYDQLNRKISETTKVQTNYYSAPVDATRTWKYDENGNVLEYKNRDGEIQHFVYDGNNKLTSETWSNTIYSGVSDYLAEWRYNEVGELLKGNDSRAGNSISKYEYTYRMDGRVRWSFFNTKFNSITVNGEWEYNYDNHGNRKFAQYNDGDLTGDYTIRAVYDDHNRPYFFYQYDHTTGVFIDDSNNSSLLKPQAFMIEYKSNGQISKINSWSHLNEGANVKYTPSVMQTEYEYTDKGQLKWLHYFGPDRVNTDVTRALAHYDISYVSGHQQLIESITASSQDGYIYDPSPEISGITFREVEREFTYDGDGQLTSTKTTVDNKSTEIPYTYVANGRRGDAIYGVDNRMLFDGKSFYTYDLEGRRTKELSSAGTVAIDDGDFGSIIKETGNYYTTPSAYKGDQHYVVGAGTFGYMTSPGYFYLPQSGKMMGRVEMTWTMLEGIQETANAELKITGIDTETSAFELLVTRTVDQSKTADKQLAANGFYGRSDGIRDWLGTIFEFDVKYDTFLITIENKTADTLLADAVVVDVLGVVEDYKWDPRNRLVEVSRKINDSPVEIGAYAYDIFDRLIGSGTGNSENILKSRHRVYDGQNAVVMYDSDGESIKVTHQMWQPNAIDRLLSVSELVEGVPVVKYAVTDQVGTVQRTFDGVKLGYVQETESFGQLANGWSEDFIDQTFAGQEFDSFTGLQYSRARWYDPRAAIFVSQDPMSFAAGDTNLYRRAGNDPVNQTDPSGHAANLIAGGIGFIGGGLIGGLYSWSSGDGFWSGALVGAAIGGAAGLTFGASLAAGGGLTLASLKGASTATLVYAGKNAAIAGLETAAEGYVAGWTGDSSFSYGGSFLKNFTVNMGLGILPGAAETKAFGKVSAAFAKYGGKYGKYAAHYGAEVGIGTTIDTAWDMGINGKSFSEAFYGNLAGNLIGQGFGDALSMGIRRAMPGIQSGIARLCFLAGTLVQRGDQSQTPIEAIGLGQRVNTDAPAEALSNSRNTWGEPDAATWKKIVLRAVNAADADVEITLLRPECWLLSQSATVGSLVEVDLPELNTRGTARVLKIDACPAIESGSGAVVTGTFRHLSADLVDVYVEGLNEPIGCTSRHPFWSVTRGDWVAACALQTGELLLDNAGQHVQVVSVNLRGDTAKVYNLEVAGPHVYRVSQFGLLVHNASFQKMAIAEAIEGGVLNIKDAVNAGVTRVDRHHLFAQRLMGSKAQTKKWFSERGIAIDRFTVEITRGEHQAIHQFLASSDWNRELRGRLLRLESTFNGSRKLTARDIWGQGYRLLREAGYRDVTFLPYRD